MRKLESELERWNEDAPDCLVVVWTEGSDIFRAEIPNVRLGNLDNDALNKVIGERVPDDHVYPKWREGITEFQGTLGPEIYVKKPYAVVGTAYDGTPFIASVVLAEVEIMEMVSKKPHPNLSKYLGCIRRGDGESQFVMGICLQKYMGTLYEAVRGEIAADQCPQIEPDAIICGIQAGLDHIHSFGLVHDDINPSNIMLDATGIPIIIDFDSCVLVGARSRGGTPGWSKCPKIAAFENDVFGLELIGKFLRRDYHGEDHSYFDNDSPD